MTEFSTKATPPNKPTKQVELSAEDLQQKVKDAEKHAAKLAEQAAIAYRSQREAEYPELGEVIDALCTEIKKISWLVSNDMSEILKYREYVKAKYPKPEPEVTEE